MRSKLNVSVVLALVGLFSVATACGDDDTIPAGTSGGGSTAGSSGGLSSGGKATGGTAAGGKAGSPSSNGGDPSGNGGNQSADGGDPSVMGGNTSSNGGHPSSNAGESGNGGDPSGNGGAAAGAGGAGGAGPVSCTEITLGEFEAEVALTYTNYVTGITPNFGNADADVFRLSIEGPPEYDGGQTGTFDLTENGDENYATCTRCFFVIADPNVNRTVFFQSEGTLEIDGASLPLGGKLDATLTNLKLVEVTIANDLTSTPVPNGACFTIASAHIEVEPPPCLGFQCNNGYCITGSYECDGDTDCADDSDEAPSNAKCIVPVGWQCDEDYVGDGDCDCGCGAKDTDCVGTTDETECQFCSECIGSLLKCPAGSVEPADTTTCL